MPGPVCKLIKKELFLKNGIKFLVNNAFEDNAIMPLICALAKNSAYIEEAYYYYLQRDGSSLNKKTYDKRWEDIVASLDYLYDKFRKFDLFDIYYEELEYIYIEYLLHAANLRFIDFPEGIVNIKKSSDIIKKKFPKWRKNKYYKCENIKYKIMCNLFFYNNIKLIKLIRRKK